MQTEQITSDKSARLQLFTSFHRQRQNRTTTDLVRRTHLSIFRSIVPSAAEGSWDPYLLTAQTEKITQNRSASSNIITSSLSSKEAICVSIFFIATHGAFSPTSINAQPRCQLSEEAIFSSIFLQFFLLVTVRSYFLTPELAQALIIHRKPLKHKARRSYIRVHSVVQYCVCASETLQSSLTAYFAGPENLTLEKALLVLGCARFSALKIETWKRKLQFTQTFFRKLQLMYIVSQLPHQSLNIFFRTYQRGSHIHKQCFCTNLKRTLMCSFLAHTLFSSANISRLTFLDSHPTKL